MVKYNLCEQLNYIESEKVKSSSLLQKSLIKYVRINLTYSLKDELVEKRGWKIVNMLLVEDFYKILNSDLLKQKEIYITDIKEWEAALGEEKNNSKK